MVLYQCTATVGQAEADSTVTVLPQHVMLLLVKHMDTEDLLAVDVLILTITDITLDHQVLMQILDKCFQIQLVVIVLATGLAETVAAEY